MQRNHVTDQESWHTRKQILLPICSLSRFSIHDKFSFTYQGSQSHQFKWYSKSRCIYYLGNRVYHLWWKEITKVHCCLCCMVLLSKTKKKVKDILCFYAKKLDIKCGVSFPADAVTRTPVTYFYGDLNNNRWWFKDA